MKKTSDEFWVSGFHLQAHPPWMEWITVKGTAFEVPGFEGVDLFLHRPFTGHRSGEQKRRNWQVSSGVTGQTIGGQHKTQKSAIAATKSRLERLGSVEDYAKMVASVIKNMKTYKGYDMVSPRYGGSEDDQIGIDKPA